MCKWGTDELVKIKIPADLACSGKSYWKKMKIDKCIASIVKALQKGGINMRGSCCGHNRRVGEIELEDGRILIIATMPFEKYLQKEPKISEVCKEE